MGMRIFGSFSSYDGGLSPPLPNPNPNPGNFRIIRSHYEAPFLIVEVQYPDCTNYEGRKILVYQDITLNQLKAQGTIDPHFSNNKQYYSPKARFEPTEWGWDTACGVF